MFGEAREEKERPPPVVERDGDEGGEWPAGRVASEGCERAEAAGSGEIAARAEDGAHTGNVPRCC
jgi:hypothetical protein